MNPNNTGSIKTTQACIEEEPLSYAQFTLLLAQYKRAVYELIQHVDNPTEMLVKQ